MRISEKNAAAGALPSREDGHTARRNGAALGAPLGPRLKLQIDLDGGGRLGPGKIRLLELIEAEGSLSRAADVMGISYRRAWLFVQQINASFDTPAVATPEHGRGGAAARLTSFGRELIARYRALEAHTNGGGGDLLSWISEHGRRG